MEGLDEREKSQGRLSSSKCLQEKRLRGTVDAEKCFEGFLVRATHLFDYIFHVLEMVTIKIEGSSLTKAETLLLLVSEKGETFTALERKLWQ
jgi:hypothetical protein